MLQQEAPPGRQYSVYFCPHEGLTFDLVDSYVIGRNGTYKLSPSQNKLLYRLVKKQKKGKQGGWCTVKELEACLRRRYKTEVTGIVVVDGKEKKYTERQEIKRTKPQKLSSVQQAMYHLRAPLKNCHPCNPLIEYRVSNGQEAYRLTAINSCAVCPGCCSLELRLS